MPASPSAPRRIAPQLLLAGAIAATVVLSACDNRSPFGDAGNTSEATPSLAASASGTSAPRNDGSGSGTTSASGAVAPTSAPPPAGGAIDDPQVPLPTKPAYAPAPAGTTAPVGTTKGPWPTTPQGRINADKSAMLNVRTMVSVVEGCHSGRPSYRDCNSHKDLGSPAMLGVTIGERRGMVRISASDHGFRITALSLSGAKFTVARGPKGDRFKCIPGPKPGACPESHQWSW